MFAPVTIKLDEATRKFSGDVGQSYYENARRSGRPMSQGMHTLDPARRIFNEREGASAEKALAVMAGLPWPGDAGWTAWNPDSVDVPPDLQCRLAASNGNHLAIIPKDKDDEYFLLCKLGAQEGEYVFWGWLLAAEAKHLCPDKWHLSDDYPPGHHIHVRFLHPLHRQLGLLWPDGTVARPWGVVTVPLVKKLWPRPDGWPLKGCGLRSF